MPRRSASRRAYDHAKERILDGRWAGGRLVSGGEVAAALGISRTPVREAFLTLAAEGLLELYPKRGALVVPVSAGEIDAVMETRELVERFALERAMERAPAALADALATALDRQEQAEKPAAFAEGDRRFHRAILAAAGNPILLELYDTLRDRQRRMTTANVAADPARRRAAILADHRALAEAVTSGDRAAALEALDRHLAATRAALRG